MCSTAVPLPPLGSAPVRLCCDPARQGSPALCVPEALGRTWGHSPGRGFAPCRCQAAPRLPLLWLGAGCDPPGPCPAMGRFPGVGSGSSCPSHTALQQLCPCCCESAAPSSPDHAGCNSVPTLPGAPPSHQICSPSRYKMSFMWRRAPRVQLHPLGAVGALAGPVPPFLLVAVHEQLPFPCRLPANCSHKPSPECPRHRGLVKPCRKRDFAAPHSWGRARPPRALPATAPLGSVPTPSPNPACGTIRDSETSRAVYCHFL